MKIKKIFFFALRNYKIILFNIVLIIMLVILFKPTLRLIFEGIHFKQLVRNVDHRMPPFDDKINTNSDGIRSLKESKDFPKEDFNILILGDSFVYGFWIGVKQAPPYKFEEKARQYFKREDINVANFGWISSSPYLSYRLLRDLGEKYNPDLILFSLDMTDYRDDYFYKSVLLQRGNYKYIYKYPSLFFFVKKITGFLDPLFGGHKKIFGFPSSSIYFVASQPMEDSLVYFDDVYDSLSLMDNYIKEKWNIPFIVFIPPRHWQYTDKEAKGAGEKGFDSLGPYALENYKYFERKKEISPFITVPLLQDFKDTKQFPLNFANDSHWNPRGARFAAELMFSHCVELNCFKNINDSATKQKQ